MLATGCWAGHSIYPAHQDGRGAHGRPGQEVRHRSASSSTAPPTGACRDPLKVPKTRRRDARSRASPRRRSRRSCGTTRSRSSRQSGRLDLAELDAPLKVDQRAALRRQLGAARPDAAESSRAAAPTMHRTARPRTSSGSRPSLIGEHTPHLARSPQHGAQRPLDAITPAVTCSVQATFTTGTLPREHGIVGNGWYFRDLAEVRFWRQSNQLVARREDLGRGQAPRPALHLRASSSGGTTCTRRADWSVTPRPMYPADGRKLPDIYADPPELRDELQTRARAVPAVQLLGPERDIDVEPRGSRSARAHVYDEQQADADARLSAAPRLRPAALRAATHPEIAKTCARSTRVRRADRARRSATARA